MLYFNFIDAYILSLFPLALGLFMIGIFGIILNNNKNLLILMLNIELIFLGICLLLLFIFTNENYFNAQIYTLIILSIGKEKYGQNINNRKILVNSTYINFGKVTGCGSYNILRPDNPFFVQRLIIKRTFSTSSLPDKEPLVQNISNDKIITVDSSNIPSTPTYMQPINSFPASTIFSKIFSILAFLILVILIRNEYFNLAAIFWIITFISAILYHLFLDNEGEHYARLSYYWSEYKNISYSDANSRFMPLKIYFAYFTYCIFIVHILFYTTYVSILWQVALLLVIVYFNIFTGLLLLYPIWLIIFLIVCIGLSSLVYLNVLFITEKRRQSSFLYKYIKKSAVLAVVENPGGGITVAAKGTLITIGIGIAVTVGNHAITEYTNYRCTVYTQDMKFKIHKYTVDAKTEQTKIAWDKKQQMQNDALQAKHRTETNIAYIKKLPTIPPVKY